MKLDIQSWPFNEGAFIYFNATHPEGWYWVRHGDGKRWHVYAEREIPDLEFLILNLMWNMTEAGATNETN